MSSDQVIHQSRLLGHHSSYVVGGFFWFFLERVFFFFLISFVDFDLFFVLVIYGSMVIKTDYIGATVS